MIVPDKLFRRICEQLLVRGDRPWDGEESRRIVALSHKALNINTDQEDFRKLTIAVFREGKMLDFGYQKKTYMPPDWESFRVAISEIMKSNTDSEGLGLFIERLKGKVASFSLETMGKTDWVVEVNKIQERHNIKFKSFDLGEKIKICDVIDALLRERIELKARCAAADMGITVEDLLVSLKESFNDLKHLKPKNKSKKENSSKAIKSTNVDFQDIISLCDTRSVDEITHSLEKYPNHVSRLIIKRWKTLQEDRIAEKLWSKSIRGTSGLIREMVIVHMDTHYRLLYRTDKKSKHPILAFGLRRDLFSIIEKSKLLVL